MRIMIVDDHQMVRDALQSLIEHEGAYRVVGHAANSHEAVEIAARECPDGIVMDVLMPDKSGIEACREITALCPEVKVLMLTASENRHHVLHAVAAGAAGYLQKHSGADRVMQALDAMMSGDFVLQGEAVKDLMGALSEVPAHMAPRGLDVLTPREEQVLRMYMGGMNYGEIAAERGNRPLTIRNTIYEIQRKLGLRSRQDLGVWAVRNGLVADDDQPS